MSTESHRKIELIVSYFIRINIHQKYSHIIIPSDIQQLIEQFGRKSIGSNLLTHTEDIQFLQLLSTEKSSIFDSKEFELLYVASQHEYSAKQFHLLCDNKGPLLVIIQSEFGNVFGGFTSKSWGFAGDGARYDDKAFLFMIRNYDEPGKSFKIYPLRPEKASGAIFLDKNHGPAFGTGCDIRIIDKCNQDIDKDHEFKTSSYTTQSSYQFDGVICGSKAYNKNYSHFFKVIDYEIFKIVDIK